MISLSLDMYKPQKHMILLSVSHSSLSRQTSHSMPSLYSPPLVFNTPQSTTIPNTCMHNPSMHNYTTNRVNRKAQPSSRRLNNAHNMSDDSSIEVTLACHRLKLWSNKNQGWEGSQHFITEKRVLSLKTDNFSFVYSRKHRNVTRSPKKTRFVKVSLCFLVHTT